MNEHIIGIGFGLSNVQAEKLFVLNKGVYEKINRDIFCSFDCLC